MGWKSWAMKRCGGAFAAALCAGLTVGVSVGAQAQIKIGQTAAFSGPGSISVQENTDGARLYLDAINAQGGIKGQRIELISMDDKYEPKLAVDNTKSLIDQGVLAMFLSRGTAQCVAQLPLLAEHRLALVAPSSGAMVLRKSAGSRPGKYITNRPRLMRPTKASSFRQALNRCAVCLIIASAVRKPWAEVICPTVFIRTSTSTL